MRDGSNKRRHRFLVCTEHMVLAEDLRDMLVGGERHDVVVNRSFAEGWEGPFDVAFFSVMPQVLEADPRVAELRAAGTHIVSMNGPVLPQETATDAGIVVLDRPFTSLDVDTLLSRLGVGAIG